MPSSIRKSVLLLGILACGTGAALAGETVLDTKGVWQLVRASDVATDCEVSSMASGGKAVAVASVHPISLLGRGRLGITFGVLNAGVVDAMLRARVLVDGLEAESTLVSEGHLALVDDVSTFAGAETIILEASLDRRGPPVDFSWPVAGLADAIKELGVLCLPKDPPSAPDTRSQPRAEDAGGQPAAANRTPPVPSHAPQ